MKFNGVDKWINMLLFQFLCVRRLVLVPFMFESMLLRWEIRDKRTEKREILGNYPLKYGDVELKRRAEKLNFERKNAPYFRKTLISYLGR